MFSLFKSPTPKGLIKYFNLVNWWLATFTVDERKYISQTYKPLGDTEDTLTKGDITFISTSASSFLSTLASWFPKEKDKHIAYTLINKAESMSSSAKPLDLHFQYLTKIQTYYSRRDTDPTALQKAKEACRQQIAIASSAAIAFRKEYEDQILPLHTGYKQLCIILEKEGEYDEAIKLANEALKEGWGDDWESRIKRLEKKRIKQK